MRKDVEVIASIVSFIVLSLGNHLTEWWGDDLHDDSAGEVPRDNDSRAFVTNKLGQLSREHNNIKKGLGDIGVELGERV